MGKNVLTEEEIKFLIVSYLTGSLNEEDLQRLKLWIDTSDENRKLFNLLKDSWVLSSDKKDLSREIEDSWQALSEKIHRSKLGLGFVFLGRKKASLFKYIKLAASWLLFFGLGSVLALLIYGEKGAKTKSISVLTPVKITAPLGSKSLIRLSDSSRIWLNAGSSIAFSSDFGVSNRSLSLEGEAYFEVAKDSVHPFIVKTQDLTIKVLGTCFNVKSYPQEETICTTLEEGLIDIVITSREGKDERILLKPNEKLIYNKSTSRADKKEINADTREDSQPKLPGLGNFKVESNINTVLTTSWKDRRWIIENERLETLAPKLERRYNMRIKFVDEQIRNYRFTGIIENETIEQIMTAFGYAAPVDYIIRKDTIWLEFNIRHNDNFRKVMNVNDSI